MLYTSLTIATAKFVLSCAAKLMLYKVKSKLLDTNVGVADVPSIPRIVTGKATTKSITSDVTFYALMRKWDRT